MRYVGKAKLLLGALGALAWLGGCEDDRPTGPSGRGIELPVFGVIASDPAGAFNASIAPTVAGSGYSVAYVSLAPGTVVRGSSVQIRNLTSGFTRTEGLIGGGLDPVSVPASAGDTLQLTVTDGLEVTARALVVVAPRRPPRVVRTEPPPRKRDVVLNARMLVVFSEPVDPATVSTTNIRLIRSGVVVSGQVTLAPDGLSASFQPDAALLSATDYTLVVEAGMRDLDGDTLSQAVTVTFTTSAAGEIAPEIATWVSRAPAPTVRTNAATAVVDGIIYLVGGDDAAWVEEELVTTVEAYNPATNTWTTKAPMPTPRSQLAAGVVDGIIYAIGGGASTGALTTVEAYDPVTDSWTARAPMPTARSGIAIGAVNGILYAVGGSNAAGEVGAVEAYDPVANSWTTRASMPTARWSVAVGVVNGILYAVGGGLGGNDGGSTAVVEAYDPVTNTWTSRPPMPTSRWSLGVGVVNNIVYAAGGNSWPPLSGTSGKGAAEAYDPATNSWRAGPPLPVQYTTLVAVVDGVIYAVIASQMFAYQP